MLNLPRWMTSRAENWLRSHGERSSFHAGANTKCSSEKMCLIPREVLWGGRWKKRENEFYKCF